MLPTTLVLAVFLVSTMRADDQPAKPVTPAEAAKKVNEKVVVEFEVKSTGGNEARFLNSEADFKDAKNFTIYIPEAALEKFKTGKIDDPKTHFKGKTIQVTGTVTLYRDKPQIKVEDPDQIKVTDKK
jgi:DNA/RNA endonuclease YhcR with UshA esterase domain